MRADFMRRLEQFLADASSCLLIAAMVLAVTPSRANAQTTAFHLHAETASGALLQLKLSGPDVAAGTLQSANLKNLSGERAVKEFVTTAGAIGAGGVASGRTFTFQLWMRKTAAIGTMVPRARVRLNNGSGTTFCTATAPGASALTV